MTRYIIGIDLGTTTNSVAYVDTESEQLQIQQFRIPQLIAEGYVEALPTLPSFCYLCTPGEWPANSLVLPWKQQDNYFVGKFAQLHGAKVPTRLVQSAKSWLCHAAANRREKILPFEAGNESFRISPVEASARYLNHLKEAWNAQMAKGDHTQEFEQQEIILTVPASFDEIARRLTVEAASQVGLSHLTLLEEPQAAFYSWLAQNETSWQHQLPLGSCVLVCDVGGGTTDFSLIEVTGSIENPVLQRMSVGDHLLLGGDNMDAAIAHFLASQFNQEISSDTWLRLKSEARTAKESLLSEKSTLDHLKIVLQSSGASVIQNSRTLTITKQEILDLLLNGFFGQYPWEEAINVYKTSGMRAMGLPYETDPSITKHLARFLAQSNTQVKAPDFVLFNGGTMKPKVFQHAILQSLQKWFPSKNALQLPSYHLDLAVARGAAYYGKVRRGIGVKISGGTARGYYLKLETKNVSQALTLLPRGIEESSSYEFPETFLLRANTPVAFQLYTSHVRLHDQSGDLIPIDLEQLQPLPPIHTILRYGKKLETDEYHSLIPVHLHIHLNAIGTLEITLKSQKTDHIWGLEFQLRSASGQENNLDTLAKSRKDEVFDQSYLVEPKKSIEELFSSNSSFKPDRIIERLELQLQQSKREWSPSILRGLGDALLKSASQRKISQTHEARWWNLAGLFLMPGYGFPLDDFRIKELWKVILSEAKLPSS
ncbi:MAG: Hsp70 family protein, partial [Parachlamydiaceae bacterium]